MKIFRVLALLGIASGAVALQNRLIPTVAAASPTATPAQTPAADSPTSPGATVFLNTCAMCHGAKMEGHPPTFPTLAGVGNKINADQIKELVRHGRKAMPAFTAAQLSDANLSSLVQYLTTNSTFMAPATSASAAPVSPAGDAHKAPSGPGSATYLQNCAFCHGRDAAGGETGPDLTRSKLVAADVNGSTIAPVVRNGRADGKMPKFTFSDAEMADLITFIHTQAKAAATRPGGRRGVDVADLQTGNVDAGKAYFNGAGGCAKCHSPTGDLAGVASRFQGLQLEERMLYPRDAKDTITVTTPSGETIKGVLAYQDEFTVGLRDSNGVYRSWPVGAIKYNIDSPVSAHVEQFPKYTDDDIHNLMAYIQTLK